MKLIETLILSFRKMASKTSLMDFVSDLSIVVNYWLNQ